MEISKDKNDKFDVLRLNGHLDTNTAPDAETALNEIVSGGGSSILVDFTDLEYISSAGLRVLLSTAKKLKTINGELVLCGMNKLVTEVFEISGFSTIFKIFGTEEEAMG